MAKPTHIQVKPVLDQIAHALHPWWDAEKGKAHKYEPLKLPGMVRDLRDEIAKLQKAKRRTDFEVGRLRASRKDLIEANRRLRDEKEALEKLNGQG